MRRAITMPWTHVVFSLFAMLICAACQAAPAPATPPTATVAPLPTATVTPAAEIELSMMCRCERDGVNKSMVTWLSDTVIPAFEAKRRAEGRPVKLTLREFAGDDEAYKQAVIDELQSGDVDMMNIDGFWIPEFVEAGYLKSLQELAGPEVDDWEGWDYISDGLRNLMGYRGKVYGIAVGTDTRVIFYRRDLLEQAGIRTPWQPESWEALLDTARTLKRELPDVTPLQINAGTSMGEATTMQGYLMLLLGTGEHIYDFSANKWIASSQGISQTLDLYKTIYVDEQLGDAQLQLAEDGRDRSFQAFRDGKIAILAESDYFWRAVISPNGQWPMEDRNDLVGWAKMPARTAGSGYRDQDYVTISGGVGMALNPRSKHPQDVWDLLSFAFSQEMLREFQVVEPRMRVRSDVGVPGDEVMTAMGQALLPLTTVRPTLPVYPQVSAAAQQMTEDVVAGRLSPAEAMAVYKETVETLVGAENILAEGSR